MRKIILRGAHNKDMNGMVMAVEEGALFIEVPETCMCISVFEPTKYTEKDTNGFDMEVWEQTDFKFNRYRIGTDETNT